MKRARSSPRSLLVAILVAAQLNATVWAQPSTSTGSTAANTSNSSSSTAGSTCMRGGSNTARRIFVALSPAITVVTLGAGFAAACYMVGSAVKGKDFKVNGNVVGLQFDFSAVDRTRSCNCPSK